MYDLSLLASIPSNLTNLLVPGAEGLLRLRSLFAIGIHDIPLLETLRSNDYGSNTSTEGEQDSCGWVACTTDEIITTKASLYDLIVELPPNYDAPPAQKRWPTIKTSDGAQVKATQRDVSRYRLLHHELWKYRHNSLDTNGDIDSDDDQMALLTRTETREADDNFAEIYDDSVVESTTWSRLAYSGFMWWASAGEADSYTTKERERDREVLGDLSSYGEGLHTAIIAYFHRITSVLINDLSALIERADEDSSDEDPEILAITKDDISGLMLDTWSEADKAFIQEFLYMYFGRRAVVDGTSLECCGVRIPIF